ncbi:hypothetical protein L6R52_08650 [Myxococcota bacterium]|nr:hypothetical protein [Myxococcota bacterium]
MVRGLRSTAIAPLVLALLASACVPARELSIEAPPGAHAALVVVVPSVRSQSPVRALAFDLLRGSAHGDAFTLGPDDAAFALYYADTLEELGLDQAPLDVELGALAPGAVDRRALPAPLTWRTAHGAFDVWEERGELPPMHVPALDVAACAQRGGCLVDREAAVCTIPCPPVEVDVDVRAPIRGEPAARCDPPSCEAPAPTETCAHDAAWPRNAVACVPAECPASGWPHPLPADALFVRAGAIGGDGSAARPFGDLRSAIDAGAGRVIAVEPGDYVEATPPSLRSGTWIMGTCARAVRVELSGSRGISMAAGATTATISGLSIRATGPATPMISASSATLVLDDVFVDGGAGSLVAVTGGRLVVRGGRLQGGTLGVWTQDADLRLSNVVVDGASNRGVDATRTSLVLSDVAVRDVDGGPSPVGIRVVDSATVSLTSVEVRAIDGPALLLQGAPRARIDDVAALDTRGVRIEGSSSQIHALHVARTEGSALRISRGTHTIDGLTIDGVRRDPSVGEPYLQVSGDGLVAAALAVVHARRVNIRGCAGWAASTQALGALTVTDGLLAGTETSSLATGLLLARSSSVSGVRLELAPRARYGVYADSISRVVLRDVAIRGLPSSGARPTDAAIASAALTSAFERISIDDAASLGVELTDITPDDVNVPQTVTLRDVHVRGARGGGLRSNVNGPTTITHLVVEDTAPFGLRLDPTVFAPTVHPPVSVLHSVAVRRIDAGTLACSERCAAGVGVYTSAFMQTTLSSFDVVACAAEGIHVEAGELDLSDGRVTQSPVGLRVVAAPFELGRVLERVQLLDNGANLRVE